MRFTRHWRRVWLHFIRSMLMSRASARLRSCCCRTTVRCLWRTREGARPKSLGGVLHGPDFRSLTGKARVTEMAALLRVYLLQVARVAQHRVEGSKHWLAEASPGTVIFYLCAKN